MEDSRPSSVALLGSTSEPGGTESMAPASGTDGQTLAPARRHQTDTRTYRARSRSDLPGGRAERVISAACVVIAEGMSLRRERVCLLS
jgi:hypothetical protein